MNDEKAFVVGPVDVLSAAGVPFAVHSHPEIRTATDIEALDTLVTDGVVTLISSTLTLLGVVVILLLLDLQLALVTFVTFPLLAVGSVAFRIAIRASPPRASAGTPVFTCRPQ